MPGKNDDNEFRENRRNLMRLNIEQIKEWANYDYLTLAQTFLIEQTGGETPFEINQTLARWFPLIRDQQFVQAFDQVITEMEANQLDEHQKRLLQAQRDMLRDINRMTEEEARHHFEVRNDPQKFEAAFAEDQAQAEYQVAIDAANRGDLFSARIHYERAVSAFAATHNLHMLALALINLANVLVRMRQLPGVEKLYEQAAAAFEQLGDTTNLGLTFYNHGRSLFLQGQLDGAYQFVERGLRVLVMSQPDAPRVAAVCSQLLLQMAQSIPLSEQINRYQHIARVFEELKFIRERARTYLQMAGVYVQMNRLNDCYDATTKGVKLLVAANAPSQEIQTAIAMHSQIWIAMGRPADEWIAAGKELVEVPIVVSRLGDMCLALTKDVASGKLSLAEALRRLREAHTATPFEAQALEALEGDLRSMLEQIEALPTEALPRFEINLTLLLEVAVLLGSSRDGSTLHLSLGRLYSQSGRYMEAAQAFERGAELAQVWGNTEFHISMRLNGARALKLGGNWSTSLERLEALQGDLQRDDPTVRLPQVYETLAWHYREQQQFNEAEQAALNGLRIIAELQGLEPQVMKRIQDTEASLHTIVGLAHKYTDRYTSAEKHFQRSLAIYRKLENYKMEAWALGNLAGMRIDLSDPQEGLRLYNLAYQMIEKLPEDSSHSFIHTGRAIVLSELGQASEARRMASLSLKVNHRAEEIAQCISILLDTAQTSAELLDVQQQAKQLLLSNPAPMVQLPILSRLVKLPGVSPEQQKIWQARFQEVGDTVNGLQGAYIHLSIAQMQNNTAAGRQTAIEHLQRCIVLVDEVASSNPDPTIQRDIFTTGSIAAQRLLQSKSRDDKADLEIILRAKARATLHQNFTPPRTLDELTKLLARQPGSVLLVEMYVLPTETRLYFVTADGLQGMERIAVSSETFMEEDAIVGLLGSILHHQAAWQSKTWKYISAQFTGALARYLKPKHLLCLVPAGLWHFLPLHACLLDGKPLIERHPVYYGPSSSILSRPGDAQRRLQRCLAVGVEFEQEARWVADWLGGRVMLGSMVDPKVVAMSMVDEDVVHFSCHGFYNAWRGSESGLILGNNSWLTPPLIEQWNTNADLVTLSACETSVSFVTAGNDMVGLDLSFLNMGAISVLGTLWRVESSSAVSLVTAFYYHLLGSSKTGVKRMSKAHALQEAVKQVRSRYNDPFFWAPFKLTGGWL